jgi:hypothetical protein
MHTFVLSLWAPYAHLQTSAFIRATHSSPIFVFPTMRVRTFIYYIFFACVRSSRLSLPMIPSEHDFAFLEKRGSTFDVAI